MNPVRDVAGRPTQEPVLRLVRSLVGVADAAVRTAPDGRVEAIAVLPEPGAHERQVRLNIASALMAAFGLAVDPAGIRVAPDIVALRAFAPEPAPVAQTQPEQPAPAQTAPEADWPAPVRTPPPAAPMPAAPAPAHDLPPAAAAPRPPNGSGAPAPAVANGGARPNGSYANGNGNGFPISPPRRVRLAEDEVGPAVGAAPRQAAQPARPQPAPPAAPVAHHDGHHGVDENGNGNGGHAQHRAHGPRHGHGQHASAPPRQVPPQPEPAEQRPAWPADFDATPTLETAELVTTRGVTFCRVVVNVRGERYTGVAEVMEPPADSIELVARITADALRSARFPRDPVQVQGAALVTIAGRPYVVAALRAWNGRAFDDLTAAVPVHDSPEEAAAQAVLRAAASHKA